jgi:hypothetical protein
VAPPSGPATTAPASFLLNGEEGERTEKWERGSQCREIKKINKWIFFTKKQYIFFSAISCAPYIYSARPPGPVGPPDLGLSALLAVCTPLTHCLHPLSFYLFLSLKYFVCLFLTHFISRILFLHHMTCLYIRVSFIYLSFVFIYLLLIRMYLGIL